MVGVTKQGVIGYQIAKGSFRRREVTEFIDQAVLLLTSSGQMPYKQRVVVVTSMKRNHLCDQGSTHLRFQRQTHQSCESVQEAIQSTQKSHNILRMYLPPAGQDFNPLQPLFSSILRGMTKKGRLSAVELVSFWEEEMKKVVNEPVDVFFKFARNAM